jgi:hypothetical protein
MWPERPIDGKKTSEQNFVSDIASVSHVALILIVTENHWEYWVQLANTNSSNTTWDQLEYEM